MPVDTTNKRGFILIVEDDPGTSELEAQCLAPLGFEIRRAASSEEAVTVLKTDTPELMLLDYSLSGTNAVELLERLHTGGVSVPPFLMVTGRGDEGVAVAAMKAGASDYIVKNSDFLQGLLPAASKTLEKTVLQAELSASRTALAEQIKLTADIINSCSAPICTFDLDCRFTSANMAMARIFNTTPEAMVGRSLDEFFHGELADKHRRDNLMVIESGKSAQFEETHIEADGQHFYSSLKFPLVNEKRGVYGTGVISTDITERKKAERLLQEMTNMQRVESLGVLAGGIAHDFNNMLTGISADLSLLEASTGDKDKKEIISEALEAARDAQTLTGQLLAFSRGGRPIKRVFCFETALREIFNLSTRGTKVASVISVSEGLWSVEGDDCQLKQAVNNLLVNAIQAMPEGGTLRVSAENLRLTAAAGDILPAGNYVKVIVADTGIGIPKAYLDSIFNPYFTTKQRGHGLGLSITWSVIKSHGGSIVVKSEPGQGTSFELLIPATGRCFSSGAEEAHEPQKGTGRILVLEDEEKVQKAARRILEALGYSCEITSEGSETLRRYAEEKGAGRPFDAVIMDLTIPGGMGGKETARLLRVSDPGALIMVSSGYSDEPVMAEYKDFGFDEVLPKPYRYEDMAAALSRLLANKRK